MPFRMMGHYRYFSMSDIEAIIDKSCVDKGGIPVVQSECAGKRVSTDSQTPGVDPVNTRDGDKDNGD